MAEQHFCTAGQDQAFYHDRDNLNEFLFGNMLREAIARRMCDKTTILGYYRGKPMHNKLQLVFHLTLLILTQARFNFAVVCLS